MSRFQSLCEKRFHLAQNQTNLHTEVLAGLTTFATMSYVLATIPNMLGSAGLPKGAVLTALILLVMSCSIAMAVYTNRPFCLAPGMSSVAILSAVDTTGRGRFRCHFYWGRYFRSDFIYWAATDRRQRDPDKRKNIHQRRYWSFHCADWA